MATTPRDLEEMYSRMTLDEEEEGGVIVGEEEVQQNRKTFVLVGKLLTEKNINFQAMQNVLASLWRPKEGVEIHDLGGQRYSFVFFHVLDLQKVIDGGPWTFEQSLLIYHKLEENEDPHLVQLNKMDIWLQIYDLPKGMISDRILQSIGNYVGTFVKTDPLNINGAWRMYVRIRVTMDIHKPLKRRMKVKREGGAWSWINFKYERLSTFCFMCGLMGHSDRDCEVVYANPDKVINRAYGTWLRAPVKNSKNQNIGARWLRNGGDSGQTWTSASGTTGPSTTVHGEPTVITRFMEVDGQLSEISGDDGVICYAQRNMGNKQIDQIAVNQPETTLGGKYFETETVVLDAKRKRLEDETDMENNGPEIVSVNVPKKWAKKRARGGTCDADPPRTMSLLAWNCRGLGKPRTIRFIKEITQQVKPNIIFLSETLAKNNKVMELCKQLNFAEYWAVDSQGHSGGLALLWKNEGGCKVIESGNHYIDFEVENDQVGRWRYTGYYGCPERNRRRESWDILRRLATNSTLPWCVIGDFNDLMFADEKREGREQPISLLSGFVDTVNDCGLMDLGFVGEKFTWEKSRGRYNWIQERLDRALANQEWRYLFPGAEVKVLEVSTSDHLPLYLQLHRQVYVPKGKRFRFENTWLKEADCKKVVTNGWESAAGLDIMEKIRFCGLKLQEWGGGISNEYKQKIKSCRVRLKKMRSRRDTYGIQTYNAVRWEFLNLLEKQEIYWKQRAKQFWLREGDQNTRFFHKYASTRRNTNLLQRIKDSNGVWRETTEEVQVVIEDYFSRLFTATSVNGKLSDREVVQQVSEQDNMDLIADITEEEVKDAVLSMHPDKSPGPDGLNPAFFQSFLECGETRCYSFLSEVYEHRRPARRN